MPVAQAAPDGQRLTVQLPRCAVVPLAVLHSAEAIQGRRFAPAVAQATLDGQRLAVQFPRVAVVPLAVFDNAEAVQAMRGAPAVAQALRRFAGGAGGAGCRGI